ncbi:MAG: family 78 glycoside hydrolase catalytic domain [Cyclobacteriaceae bacterium]
MNYTFTYFLSILGLAQACLSSRQASRLCLLRKRTHRTVDLVSLFALCFLFGSISSFDLNATDMQVREGVSGTWYKPDEDAPKYNWGAQWIWLDNQIESGVLLARRNFDLELVPEEAVLRITASSKYQLYINGEYVCRGPARSAPHHQSFDILDITRILRKGKNSIAVRIHHQKKKFSYHFDGRAGLLAQLDLGSGMEPICTGSTWKVSLDPSWDNDAPVISRFQQVVNDRVDFRKNLNGWNQVGFDDSGWLDAKTLIRNVGWPAHQKNARPGALINPWTDLVPREVPYLIETDVKAVNVIETVEIDGAYNVPLELTKKIDKRISKSINNYRKKGTPLELPASSSTKSWFVLFDFGQILNGMAKLEIEGVSGTQITIVGAPFIIDDKFTHKVLDSEYLDQIILSGSKDEWEATYFKPYRYLGVIVNGAAAVKLHTVGTHRLQYPFKKKGNIQSSDAPWIQSYMDATAKTIDVCTTDAYTDNYRERRQYAQTGYYAALGNYFIYGDQALQRRYLIQTAQEQDANGIMPAYGPAASNDYMVIMDSNCLWIRSLRNYLLYSGDFKTTKELLPAATKMMELLHSYTNELGMIYEPPYPYWLDHALLDRRGANFNLNGHYLGALEDFFQILVWVGESNGQLFAERADLLRKSLQTHLWDETKGLFVDAWIDGKRSKMFSEHSNGTALALNIATKEQADRIANQLLVKDDHDYVRRASRIIMVTPAMSYYLHKGLCEYGYVDQSFEMFRSRFDKMLAPETNGTLWEEWRLDGIGRAGFLQMGRTRSDAQTESAFAPALFAEYLLGVTPTQPGMKEVEIKRPASSLKQVQSIIPSPLGKLEVKWEFDDKGGGELVLQVPGNMIIKLNPIDLNSKKIMINGMTSNVSTIRLSAGSHRVTF